MLAFCTSSRHDLVTRDEWSHDRNLTSHYPPLTFSLYHSVDLSILPLFLPSAFNLPLLFLDLFILLSSTCCLLWIFFQSLYFNFLFNSLIPTSCFHVFLDKSKQGLIHWGQVPNTQMLVEKHHSSLIPWEGFPYFQMIQNKHHCWLIYRKITENNICPYEAVSVCDRQSDGKACPNVHNLSDNACAQHYFILISPQDLCYFTLTTTLKPSTDKPEHAPWQVTLFTHMVRTQINMHADTSTPQLLSKKVQVMLYPRVWENQN